MTSDLPNSTDAFRRELAELREHFARTSPEMALTVSDPALDLEGYVVVWNTAIAAGGPLAGAGKGGTRCEATLDLAQVARLAQTMARKNAAAGLPLGGAKSGVRMDKNDPHYERKWRRFVELTSPILHERGGCFGGYGYDKGCRIPDNALWAIDELTSKGLGSSRSFTGKPVELGGTDYDVEGIAGLGVAVAARTLLDCHGATAKGARFGVQGMGAMGAGICRHFTAFGGQLAAMSDPLYGGTWIFNAEPPEALIRALGARDVDTVKQRLPEVSRRLSEDATEILYQDVDVLFPAATEDVITAANASRIQARTIAEAANNPTTGDAHRILFERGVRLIPDIIANAGGIVAAFVEMTTPTTPEIIASRRKVQQAKEMAIAKIEANTRRMAEMVMRLDVRADEVADYMALRAIRSGKIEAEPRAQ
ncbi:MAG TPA: Glu/Leu/Phe/Val dehydrogenase dimerization domain-containing protein [Burkholderiales bacterium]|nr:Glu/Leu/Phe/Val dehydrogenase dimerization domain-containing protein [Burkholderiales bacterium]